MLREVNFGGPRRQFSDDYFDLFVWENGGLISRFQLCYDKYGDQKSLTWSNDGELSHAGVDEDNERHPYPMSPILLPDGRFNPKIIIARFNDCSAEIDPRVASVVLQVLSHFPHHIKVVA